MGDHRVDLDAAVHIPVDDLRHVGASARAAERGAFPHPPGDELERPRRDLLAGLRHADDDALAPAAMAAFERGAHRSEEHTSELQSLMRISYAVFCLKKKTTHKTKIKTIAPRTRKHKNSNTVLNELKTTTMRK